MSLYTGVLILLHVNQGQVCLMFRSKRLYTVILTLNTILNDQESAPLKGNTGKCVFSHIFNSEYNFTSGLLNKLSYIRLPGLVVPGHQIKVTLCWVSERSRYNRKIITQLLVAHERGFFFNFLLNFIYVFYNMLWCYAIISLFDVQIHILQRSWLNDRAYPL